MVAAPSPVANFLCFRAPRLWPYGAKASKVCQQNVGDSKDSKDDSHVESDPKTLFSHFEMRRMTKVGTQATQCLPSQLPFLQSFNSLAARRVLHRAI